MYQAEFESRVAGIPCIIGVTHYVRVKGSYSYNAASDMDYYGYTECDFVVLDRRGRPALWLERKLTDSIQRDIEQEIAEYFDTADCF